MKRFILFNLIFISIYSFAQYAHEVTIRVNRAELYGTLLHAKHASSLVIIQPGSGPTDRDGNQEGMQSNCYLKIATYLCQLGYSSLRIDKRGVGKSDLGLESEAQLQFSQYVKDLHQWVTWAKDSAGFKNIILLGHSEGALVALQCMNMHPELQYLISVSGAGRPADIILKEQLTMLPQNVKKLVYPMIDSLKTGKRISNVPILFYTLFRPDVQPYLISWFAIDPLLEAKKCIKKVMIIQGEYDIQVGIKDAENLKNAFVNSELCIIHKMNHVLTKSKTMDKKKQIEDYTNAQLKLHPGFKKAIRKYLNSIKT
jgi:pimeloyl-ACP methyl ester carboxylesterase